MTIVALVMTGLSILLGLLWCDAERDNARLREEIDALAGHLQMATDDADAIMAARLDAHNELLTGNAERNLKIRFAVVHIRHAGRGRPDPAIWSDHPTFDAFGRKQ